MWRRSFVLFVLGGGVAVVACGGETFSSSDESDGGWADAATVGDGASPSDGAISDGPTGTDGGPAGARVIVSGLDNPHDLLVAHGRLYWTAYSEAAGTGSIGSAAIDGTDVKKLAVATHANRIASDDTTIYWTDFKSANTAASTIETVPIAGGPKAVFAAAVAAPMGIAVHGKSVFAIVQYGLGSGGSVTKWDKSGAFEGSFAVNLYSPVSIAANDSSVVWTQLGPAAHGGEVVVANLDGGIVSTQTGVDGAWGLALAGNAAFYTAIYAPDASASTPGRIFSTGLTAGEPPFELATGTRARPYFITTDATNVYWTEEGDGPANGAVRWHAQVGATAEPPIALNAQRPHGIAVDDHYVYWTEYGGNDIYRAPKP